MRPLHGLLLLLVLALLLVGGLLWLGGGPETGKVAEPVLEPTPTAPSSPTHVAELSSTESGEGAAERGLASAGSQVPARTGGAVATAEAPGLFGVVLGPDGKGVPGAKVLAAPADGMDMIPLEALDPKSMPWVKRADALTDAEGKFALALSGQAHVRLAVRAAGFAPLDAERTLARGERDLGNLTLEAGVVLEGRVIDPLGRPVSEAELFPRAAGGSFTMTFLDRNRVPLARTDREGRFKVDMLAPGPWRLLVSSTAHPDKSFEGQTDAPGARVANLEFALEQGAEILGRVSGASGDVLATLGVSATPRGDGEESGASISFGPDGFSAPRRAKVAADGSFTLRGLKPNQSYRLSAARSENGFLGGMAMFGARGGVQAKAGDRGVEVPYKPEGAIVCQVVDAESGAPITELDVKAGYRWTLPLMDDKGRPQRHFPEGKVRYDRVLPRMGMGRDSEGLKLRIDATGHKPYESAELNPVQGQDLDLGVIRLERAPVCRITVVDLSSGSPVAGAEVTLREAGQEGGLGRIAMRFGGGGEREGTVNDQGISQGKTGPDGEVVLASFPGKRATLRVKHPEHAVHESAEFLLSPGSDHRETIKLARGGDVLVQVRDAQDRPVASLEIEHAFTDEDEENPWMRRMTGESETRTDARGELLFSHLQPGVHRFRISEGFGGMRIFGGGGGMVASRMVVSVGGEDEGSKEEPWTTIEVLEGAQSPLRLIAPARGRVVGYVREGGKGLAGAGLKLDAAREGGGGMPGMDFFGPQNGPKSRGSGEYEIENVKPGKYVLRVTHASRAMAWEGELEVREGETRFDVDLPIAIVEGRVSGPDGKPIAGARVRAQRAQNEAVEDMVFSMVVSSDDGGDAMTFGGNFGEQQRTDADGRYTLRGVQTGVDLQVHVTGKDLQPGNSEKFRLAPDQTLRGIDLTLKQGGSAEISVFRAGQPARGVLVSAHHKGGGGDEAQSTGPAGVAKFSGLVPGEWEFRVTDFGGEATPDGLPNEGEPKPLAVEAGKTGKLRIDLP